MKIQNGFGALLAVPIVAVGLMAAIGAHAQGMPPPYAPPQPVMAPRDVAVQAPADDSALRPQEIIGILRSTGFAPLGPPVRRGRFYDVAALHPDGEDGRVTIDALTGRFIRFVPADMLGSSMASYPPPAFARPPRGLRPPMPLPNVAARAPAASTPLPPERPQAAPAVRQETRSADARTAEAKSAEPVEVKRSFGAPPGPALQPTGAMPPVLGFE